MKVVYGRNENLKIFIENRITISERDDIEFDIYFNQFGELVVRKTSFGEKESTINIKPSVSNEIRIL